MYTVELPNPEREDYMYQAIAQFRTKEEAIEWAIENLGADKEGNINIIGYSVK